MPDLMDLVDIVEGFAAVVVDWVRIERDLVDMLGIVVGHLVGNFDLMGDFEEGFEWRVDVVVDQGIRMCCGLASYFFVVGAFA